MSTERWPGESWTTMSKKKLREQLQLLTLAQLALNSCEMGRRRVADIEIPEHVQPVKARGREYFYYQEGRGRKDPTQRGERIKIHGSPRLKAGSQANLMFWAEYNRVKVSALVYPVGSIGNLIDLYYKDDAFTKLADRSRTVYALHLDRMRKPEAWGLLKVGELTPFAAKMGRDALADTPGMANQMLSVGSTLYAWAMLYDLAKTNPFEKVPWLEVPDRGHIPWPQWVIDNVRQHAPPDLVRMVTLGLATCQRESDLVRMGPQHREVVDKKPGIWCRPKKTTKRRKAVFIPLATVDALELDRWAHEPMKMTWGRWKQPIPRHRADLYLYSPKGAEYNPSSLRARWGRWLASETGEALCKHWRTWLEEMKRRYEWEIDPEDSRGPTIHGLRGTGFLLRFAQGYDVAQIANDIGASRQTVEHYMRFRDQMGVAAAGDRRLRVVKSRG